MRDRGWRTGLARKSRATFFGDQVPNPIDAIVAMEGILEGVDPMGVIVLRSVRACADKRVANVSMGDRKPI